MDFPQYRKYSDNNTIFKITSQNTFIEIKKVGRFYMTTTIECKAYPEKLFLNDLIQAELKNISVIEEKEFHDINNEWEIELTEFK